jgi:hypothetical protein
LELRTHPRYGKDVILSIDRGQLLWYSDGCSVFVRYDDGLAWEYPARELANYDSTVVFLQGYADIVRSLKSASKVRIEVRFYQLCRVVENDADCDGTLDRTRLPPCRRLGQSVAC